MNRGDIFIIMGGSGCGKTTLLRHMIGLNRPQQGYIHFGECNYWQSDEPQQAAVKRRFGVMFQGGALWSSLTLAENVGLPLHEYTDLNPEEIEAVVSFKLALVGLAGYEDFYPAQLSGGMKKRASLARAIALDPEILFFDEPGSGLDPFSAKRLDDLILELRDSLGMTIIVVSHEPASILTIGNNSVFLDDEKRTIIESGNPSILLKQAAEPKVRAFLNRGEYEHTG
ncbi:MAG: ABC transporter related [Gammaproteobacteria bacterium]|nr:ABC transporter related [Gammaproteobacteria bacterium]